MRSVLQRMDNLARHRAQHERPEAKQRLPKMRPAAHEPGPSPKQRSTVSPPVRTPMDNSVAPDVFSVDPETRVLYLGYWQSIRTQEATANRIQDRYNITLHEMTASSFPEMVRSLYRQQTTAFKINLSFGFILRNIETRVFRQYHPSQNNGRFFETPHFIRKRRLGEVFGGVEPI